MSRLAKCAGLWIVLSAVALQGCGEGTGRSADAREDKQAALQVSSSALDGGRGWERIPIKYVCKEESVWFPLEWSPVPEGAAEIAIAIILRELRRTDKGLESRVQTEWVLGGLHPSTRFVIPGRLPANAFLKGHNVNFDDCPSRSRDWGVVFQVHALSPENQLHEREAVGAVTIQGLEEVALASGSLSVIYGYGQ